MTDSLITIHYGVLVASIVFSIIGGLGVGVLFGLNSKFK